MRTSIIDTLGERELVALARFAVNHARLRAGPRWRTAFFQCARGGHFLPYAAGSSERVLQGLVQAGHGPGILGLRTEALLARAGQMLDEAHTAD